MQRRALLERAGQSARKCDLQTVENPGDSERQHHTGVKAAPEQGVETEGNAGFDNTVVFDNAVVNGLRGPACSIQIALPWLQAHEALPVRYCGKAKDIPAVETTLSRITNVCQGPGFPFAASNRMGVRPLARMTIRQNSDGPRHDPGAQRAATSS